MNPTHYRDNRLFIEDIPLSQIATEYGTPVYVYSEAALSQAFNSYLRAFSALSPLICYAVKANANLSILRHFAQLGAGFDIVSGGELARVLAAGARADTVVFSGVGKSDQEMAAAMQAGILCFNVESVNELARLDDVAGMLGKVAPISLRINPDVDAQTHPYISTGLKDNKFGIAHEQALDAYCQAQGMHNLRIIGIDCHIGSQLIDTTPMLDALDRLLDLVDRLKQHNIELQHLDIGGGLGIRYKDEVPPDLAQLANQLSSRLANRPLTLLMEPGRSLVGNAGILLTKLEYLKRGQDKNFAIIDAAMNDLMRPSLYAAYHHVLPVEQQPDLPPLTVDVVGPVCESSDVIGRDRQLALREGDLLAIMSAGAYGASMASNYNTRPRAAEVLVCQDQSRIIRRRETLDELLINEMECLE